MPSPRLTSPDRRPNGWWQLSTKITKDGKPLSDGHQGQGQTAKGNPPLTGVGLVSKHFDKDIDRAALQLRCWQLGISSQGTTRELAERYMEHEVGRDRAPSELRGRGHAW